VRVSRKCHCLERVNTTRVEVEFSAVRMTAPGVHLKPCYYDGARSLVCFQGPKCSRASKRRGLATSVPSRLDQNIISPLPPYGRRTSGTLDPDREFPTNTAGPKVSSS